MNQEKSLHKKTKMNSLCIKKGKRQAFTCIHINYQKISSNVLAFMLLIILPLHFTTNEIWANKDWFSRSLFLVIHRKVRFLKILFFCLVLFFYFLFWGDLTLSKSEIVIFEDKNNGILSGVVSKVSHKSFHETFIESFLP